MYIDSENKLGCGNMYFYDYLTPTLISRFIINTAFD